MNNRGQHFFIEMPCMGGQHPFFQCCSLGARTRRGPRLRGRFGSDRGFYFLAVISQF